MSDSEVLDRALAAGWEIIPALLYDEDCIVGHRWIGPNGETFYALDDDVPEEVRRLFDPKVRAEQEERSKKVGEFADFLHNLMSK